MEPRTGTRTVVGRLMMADFKEDGPRIRVHPAVGEPVFCEFDETMRDEVYENVLCLVRVTGLARTDATSARIRSLRIVDIARVEESAAGSEAAASGGVPYPGEFWQAQTIEELASSQGVAAPPSFDELLGGWPEEEAADGFEGAVARWRLEDAEEESS